MHPNSGHRSRNKVGGVDLQESGLVLENRCVIISADRDTGAKRERGGMCRT